MQALWYQPITKRGVLRCLFYIVVGRTEPNLDDLGLAFHEMGVDISELMDYVKHVDPIPFALDVPR